ncbi:MAG: phosphatidylserine decarboxylase [Planctomycetota bacterium]|jgi:phosphatidylserine decarboxylase
MSTPWLRRLSHFAGWLADRKVPTPLRGFFYGSYCRLTGADAGEAQLPVKAYPSMGAFFVRRLKPGARTWESREDLLPAPCDGCVQDLHPIKDGTILQAKGSPYSVAELLGDEEAARELEGGWAWTIYLSPRDYHRVHTPEAGVLESVRWIDGTRYSVAPKVLAKRPRVFAQNERAVLTIASSRARYQLVMVGALNVGRIRVIGVESGASPGARGGTGEPAGTLPRFERGDELARFEMGSTVVLLFPKGSAVPLPDLAPEHGVRLGSAIGLFGGAGA